MTSNTTNAQQSHVLSYPWVRGPVLQKVGIGYEIIAFLVVDRICLYKYVLLEKVNTSRVRFSISDDLISNINTFKTNLRVHLLNS